MDTHLHLADVLMSQRARLQVKEDKAAQKPVVEDQIHEEMLFLEGKAHLTSHEGKAIAKFQQKFLKVTNETPLQFRFRIAALRLHAQKLQDIRLLQDILRLRDDVAFAGQLHDGILVLAQGDALIQRTADLPVQPPHAPVPLRRLDLIEAARQGVLNT